uniref:Uncharacterized protein n=1 Tax=Cannabis sativa TaxID=3483 RepID=A0A803PSS2_CANSA
MSVFTRHPVPFKYLGIPICAKRISDAECTGLVQKMTARIKVWSSRNISFAGRVVLINSVLLTVHTYWCQLLILPKKIISEIESVCRNFLWRQGRSEGSGSVAWRSLCKPKAAGGLGFMNTSDWNEAALFKHYSITGEVISAAARNLNTIYGAGFSQEVLQQVKTWLDWRVTSSSLQAIVRRVDRGNTPS